MIYESYNNIKYNMYIRYTEYISHNIYNYLLLTLFVRVNSMFFNTISCLLLNFIILLLRLQKRDTPNWEGSRNPQKLLLPKNKIE